MDLRRLREATRPEHEATETAVPLMAADLSRADYVRVLERFYAIVNAWDRYAAEARPAALADLVAHRRRSASLQSDLESFGVPFASQASPGLQGEIDALVGNGDDAPYRFLGAMYVLEGSTLGGRFIAEHVEPVLGLTPGEGDAFFRGYGAQTIPMWREFQAILTAVPDERSDDVISAAKGMFALFQTVLLHGKQPGAGIAHPAEADPASYRSTP